ncbi:MAG: biotin/lipoyl-binding protein, partial [Pseudomonadota bacterium]
MTNDPKELRETLGLDQGRRVRRWLLVILVLVLAGAGLAAARHFQPPKETGPTYETMEARRGDLVVTVTATGQVEPLNTVQVGTEVSGTVATVEVDYNDSVTRGQVLARLDTARLAAQLAQSRAAVNSARANRAQARAQALVARQRLDRLKEARRLSGGRTPAESEIEQQEAVWRAADAGVAAAEASVE